MCGNEIVEVDVLLCQAAIDDALREALRRAHLPRYVHNLPLLLHTNKLHQVNHLLFGRLHPGLFALGVSRGLVNQRQGGGHHKSLPFGIPVGAYVLQNLLQLLKVSLLAHPVRLVDGEVADGVKGGQVGLTLLHQVPQPTGGRHHNGGATVQQSKKSKNQFIFSFYARNPVHNNSQTTQETQRCKHGLLSFIILHYIIYYSLLFMYTSGSKSTLSLIWGGGGVKKKTNKHENFQTKFSFLKLKQCFLA